MNHRLNYRLMEEKDIEAVYGMNVEYFSQAWSRQAIVDLVKDKTMLYLVAEDEDENVVGYCGLYQVMDEGNITQVAVKKEMRGKKIGTNLIDKMLILAKERKMTFFTLEVRVSNYAAIALYKGAKFEEQGRRKNYYKDPVEDALIMNYTIDEVI